MKAAIGICCPGRHFHFVSSPDFVHPGSRSLAPTSLVTASKN
jgi:hypothetical protein